MVPAAHVPAAEQQPPLQLVTPAPPHAAWQVCAVVLQAWPVGQSAATLQPQVCVVRQA